MTGDIAPEDFSDIIEAYDEERRPVSPDQSIKLQFKEMIRQVSSYGFSVIVWAFAAVAVVTKSIVSCLLYIASAVVMFGELIAMLVEDIKREFSSDRDCPDRGVGWELFRQAVILLSFGLLATSTHVLFHWFPVSPPHPILIQMIEWTHWGYYPLVISIQTIRYFLYEIRQAITELRRS